MQCSDLYFLLALLVKQVHSPGRRFRVEEERIRVFPLVLPFEGRNGVISMPFAL